GAGPRPRGTQGTPARGGRAAGGRSPSPTTPTFRMPPFPPPPTPPQPPYIPTMPATPVPGKGRCGRRKTMPRQPELFARPPRATPAAGRAPLAERMRPHTADEFVGQEHLLGPGRVLREMLEG